MTRSEFSENSQRFPHDEQRNIGQNYAETYREDFEKIDPGKWRAFRGSQVVGIAADRDGIRQQIEEQGYDPRDIYVLPPLGKKRPNFRTDV